MFNDRTGLAESDTINKALDDLLRQRIAYNIKIVNLSFGGFGEDLTDPNQRSKVNTLVANGIVVVAAAGNAGNGEEYRRVHDPGRAGKAITAGASTIHGPRVAWDIGMLATLKLPNQVRFVTSAISLTRTQADPTPPIPTTRAMAASTSVR